MTTLQTKNGLDLEIVKSVKYKGQTINVVETFIEQRFAIIGEDANNLYASVADAKRVINGQPTKYVID